MPTADDAMKVWEFLQPHWPGIAWMTMAMMIGQVMAGRVFTLDQAKIKRPSQNFWWWMRKTLALHPVATGLAIGIFWVNPEGVDPAWNRVASMVYFAAFGAASTWAYEVLAGLAKKKGIVLELPGGDMPSTVPTVAKDPDPTPAATEIEPDKEK